MSDIKDFEVDTPLKPNSLLRTLWYETDKDIVLSTAKEFWDAVQREQTLPEGITIEMLTPRATNSMHELYYLILVYITLSATVAKRCLTHSPLTVDYIQNYWDAMIRGAGVNNATAKSCTDRMFTDLDGFILRISQDIRSRG
jgi:hypothetical protein